MADPEENAIVHRIDPRRWSLREFCQVLSLNGLEQSVRSLLATDHLLELGRPALREDRAGRVRDEVHRAIGLGDGAASGQRGVDDRAGCRWRDGEICRATG